MNNTAKAPRWDWNAKMCPDYLGDARAFAPAAAAWKICFDKGLATLSTKRKTLVRRTNSLSTRSRMCVTFDLCPWDITETCWLAPSLSSLRVRRHLL